MWAPSPGRHGAHRAAAKRRPEELQSRLAVAAVAVAHGLPVVTQDADFDVLAGLGLVEVVRV